MFSSRERRPATILPAGGRADPLPHLPAGEEGLRLAPLLPSLITSLLTQEMGLVLDGGEAPRLITSGLATEK